MSAVCPTFDAFQRDPELGVLAALDTLLTVARFTLIEIHPTLWLEESVNPSPAEDNLRDLVDAIELLHRRIDGYVNPSVVRWLGDDGGDIPF